jgi:hypothetical protein
LRAGCHLIILTRGEHRECLLDCLNPAHLVELVNARGNSADAGQVQCFSRGG